GRSGTAARLDPRSPCGFWSGGGIMWLIAQMSCSRAKASRLRAASRGLPVSAPKKAPPSKNEARDSAVARLSSRLLQLHVLQRQRAYGLAGCRKDGIEHSRRSHTDGRLAHTAPEPARGGEHRLDLREVLYQHHLIG